MFEGSSSLLGYMLTLCDSPDFIMSVSLFDVALLLTQEIHLLKSSR